MGLVANITICQLVTDHMKKNTLPKKMYMLIST